VCRDSVEQLFVKSLAKLSVMLTLQCDHRLESLQGLERAFETDRTWLKCVFGRSLSNDRANEIVGQNVGSRVPSEPVPGTCSGGRPFAKSVSATDDEHFKNAHLS
jgi:hypothetical protein